MPIDIHHHLEPSPVRIANESAGERGDLNARALAARHESNPALYDLDLHIPDLEASGIEHAILSSSPPASFPIERAAIVDFAASCNDELDERSRDYGGRFSIMAMLPLPFVDESIAELERMTTRQQVRGVAMWTVSRNFTLDQAEFEPIYKAIAAKCLPVFIHPAQEEARPNYLDWRLSAALGAPFSSSVGLARLMLSGMLDRVPDLTVVAAHLGGTLPYLAQRLVDQSASGSAEHDVLYYLRNRIFLETCSYHTPALRCATETVGFDRILMGTDYPVRGSTQRAIDDVRAVFTDPVQYQAVTGGTASQLFRHADIMTE